MSFFGSLFSKAVPMLTKAFSVGKSLLPTAISAVGKIAGGINTAKAVGKTLKGVAEQVAPELVNKVESSRAFQTGKNLLGKAEQGLGLVEQGLNTAQKYV
jgi:hypothetical protein